MKMALQSYSLFPIIFFICTVANSSSFPASAHEQNRDEEIKSVGRRFLLGFKETPKGSNVTFDCSPSGPCVPCVSSEKRKEKYRCSETGYRIPFKCKEMRVEVSHKKDGEVSHKKDGEVSHKKDGEETTQNGKSNVDDDDDDDEDEEVDESAKPRNLRDDTPASKVKPQSYKTYRSCVPSADEEKISFLGFEAFMLGLFLISGSAIYIRKKQTVPMLGVSNGRPQSNSRS